MERAALGDLASQERLVAANLAMVLRLAEARADRGLPVGDLVQEGSLGLLEAVRTFATDGGADFGAFAERKAGEQMDAALAAETATVREAELLVAAASDYERTEILLHKLLRRPATEAEIAEKLEWTVDRTRYVAWRSWIPPTPPISTARSTAKSAEPHTALQPPRRPWRADGRLRRVGDAAAVHVDPR